MIPARAFELRVYEEPPKFLNKKDGQRWRGPG
jgi:hypothetical protein